MKFGVLSGVNCARKKVIEVKVRKRLCTDEKKKIQKRIFFSFFPQSNTHYTP